MTKTDVERFRSEAEQCRKLAEGARKQADKEAWLRLAAGYDETMRTGQTRYGAGDVLAVPAIRKDGSRISVEFTIVPFRDASEAMVGIAAVLRDVTQRFEETKRLRRQILSLEARGAF